MNNIYNPKEIEQKWPAFAPPTPLAADGHGKASSGKQN